MNLSDNSYVEWISNIKQKIQSAQIKTALIINRELIMLYWDLGKSISEKIKHSNWGDKVLENISKDLRSEFPNMKGFSTTNLGYIKRFYEYFNSLGLQNQVIYPQLGDKLQSTDNQSIKINPQLGGEISDDMVRQHFIANFITEIPWGHIKHLIDRVKDFNEVIFYIEKIKEHNWSRNALALQIKSDLYSRTGKSVTNFKNTLPESLSDLAQQTLKDPYVFDFLQLSEKYIEKDIENQLVAHIQKFLLELGKGFAFVGQQYHLSVNNRDLFLDLLFYHTNLKCYVVIELKNDKFEPEYAGKLNYYLSAVDSVLKSESDKPTIGILLCRDKNNFDVEFALRNLHSPIGVSEFELTQIVPDELKSSLPTIEEVEKELNKHEGI